jgi:hypothetical protein
VGSSISSMLRAQSVSSQTYAIKFSVRGRDLGGTVAEAQERIAQTPDIFSASNAAELKGRHETKRFF